MKGRGKSVKCPSAALHSFGVKTSPEKIAEWKIYDVQTYGPATDTSGGQSATPPSTQRTSLPASRLSSEE